MTGFDYQNGVLHAENVALPQIAQEVGTPFFCYSANKMRANFNAYATAVKDLDVDIFYAIKANSNIAVVKVFGDLGGGADVVSEGEMQRALAAGIPAAKIIFSGVGKTKEALAAALVAGVGQINLESVSELNVLNEIAASKGVVAQTALRVNPDVDAKTHAKITTGTKENKFGVDIDKAPEVFRHAADNCPAVRLTSLAMHIGSQLMYLDPYQAAYTRMAEMTCILRGEGHVIDHLDLGGGIGVDYGQGNAPDLNEYAEIIKNTVGGLGCRLSIEPGRSLVGDAGILVTRVIYVKVGAERRFVIVDGAMNDLIRPTLYEAHHDILLVEKENAGPSIGLADIVGPICESGDYLAKGRELPEISEDELLVIDGAGAYGAVMSSYYNTRPIAPEVLVDGNKFATVRTRPTVQDLIDREGIPAWL